MTQSKASLIASFDRFTEGFFNTALWASTYDNGVRDDCPMDDDFYVKDFTFKALKELAQDCKDFQDGNRELLDMDEQDESRQGHDFWLTRCGHGAGFWDGDYPKAGDKLTEASKAYGEVDLMPYRGKIYC